MHRGFVPETTKQIDSIYDWIYLQHKKKSVKQAEVAAVLGVSREDYGYKLRKRRLSLRDTVLILDFFGKDISECIK